MNATQEFAKSAGYSGNDPHMLAMMEKMRLQGIREARAHHMARLKRCRSLHNLHMFAAAIHPADSVGEALEDNAEIIRAYRRMPTWMKQRRYVQMMEAKEMVAVLRYFRRYGERIFARRAA